MGIFNRKPPVAGEVARPTNLPASDRTAELNRMTGFEGLDALRTAAPSSTGTESQRPVRSRGRTSQPQAPTPEEVEKARLRAEAMQNVGHDLMGQLAEIPYETWAFMTADPDMSLKPEERDKLAKSYFLLAQTLNPDFSKPKWLIWALIFHNAGMVADRLRIRAAKLAKAATEAETVATISDKDAGVAAAVEMKKVM